MVLFGPLSDMILIEIILIISSVLFMIIPLGLITDKIIKNPPVINKKDR